MREKTNSSAPHISKWLLISVITIAVLTCFYATSNIASILPSDKQVYLYALSAICILALLALGAYAFTTLNPKQNIEELEAQREQYFLQEKMASLGQMVAGVAHEINTPLSYINNNVELINRCVRGLKKDVVYPIEELRNSEEKSLASILKNQREIISAVLQEQYPKKTDRAIELGEDAEQGLKNISELVETLKDFSRVDRKQRDYADIHELIDISLKVSDRHIEKNHVDVIKKYSLNTPLLFCNPSKLNQVFLNAIINACQAIIGGGQLIIETKYDENKKEIYVTFTDDGMGMTRKTRHALFDPFYTTKDVGEGTGLGMSIVSSIIKEHKGKIFVDSQLGKGTSLSFAFKHSHLDPILEEEL